MNNQENIESKILEHYEKIREFAQTEINRTMLVYKFLFWAITIILAVGITIGGILIGNSLKEIEVKYDNAYQKAVSEERERIKAELNKTWDYEKSELIRKIDKEFSRENISWLVETNAKQRIDLVADKIIEQQIENKIAPVQSELTRIKINTANSLDKLIFDYLELGVFNNSSNSFSILYEYSIDDNYKFQAQAKKIMESKIIDLDLFYLRKYGSSGSIIDFKEQYLDSLYFDYYTNMGFDNRIYFLEEFWKTNHHSKKDKLEFMTRIFENEVELRSSYFISKILVQELKLNKNPADFNGIKRELEKKH